MKLGVKLALLAVTVLAATIAIAAPKHSGRPGPYRYWHHGKCDDATDKKASKTWTDDILSKFWKP
jgi:hypothetical protein